MGDDEEFEDEHREAIYTVSIHLRDDEAGPVATTIPVSAPAYEHDFVLAEAVADIAADQLGSEPADLVGLGQPSKPGGPEIRGMGWVLGPDQRHPHGGIPAMVDAATAWFAADALDLSWLETEYLPSQW